MAFTGKSVYIYIYIYIYTNVTRYAGNNTDLSSDSNILNALMVKIMQRIFAKLANDIQVDRLCTCGSLVIDF